MIHSFFQIGWTASPRRQFLEFSHNLIFRKDKRKKMTVTTPTHKKNTTNISGSVRCYSIHIYCISATSKRTKRHICPIALVFKWQQTWQVVPKGIKGHCSSAAYRYPFCSIRVPILQHTGTHSAAYRYPFCSIQVPILQYTGTHYAAYIYPFCSIHVPILRHTGTHSAAYRYPFQNKK